MVRERIRMAAIAVAFALSFAGVLLLPAGLPP
jgi:hypothetical protein